MSFHWLFLAAAVAAYMVVTRVSWYLRARRLRAKSAPFFNDHSFGFWFTKQVLNRAMTGDLPVLLVEIFKQMKTDTFHFRVLGNMRFCTKDPENIKAILGTQFNDFSLGLRYDQFFPVLGDGIFTLDGAGWKHSRAMLKPQFAREQISHVAMLEPHVQQVIRRVKATKGLEFDLQPLFFKLTIDSGTQFLFGESCSSLRDDIVDYSELDGPAEAKNFPEAFNITQTYLLKRVSLSRLYWLLNTKEFKDCTKIVHDFADYYVNKALAMDTDELEKQTQDSYIFLYELSKQTRNPKVLRDQCLNILVAARDTTASLLSFLFFELGRRPDVFKRLREEIVEAFGEGDNIDLEKMTFESLKKLEYLKCVLNEILRMYPSVPQNSRISMKDTTLPRGGGPNGDEPIFIPKKTPVLYSVYAMHRDPRIYGEDANEFKPERWIGPELKKVGWGFLPFNGGPRICLGQQFALTEASYVTARLLQSFSSISSSHGPADPKMKTHLTMSLFDGANVAMV